MLFQTYGDRKNPAMLFFHAMGVTGLSSGPVLKIFTGYAFLYLPTSTVYCKGQKYVSKADEIRQVEEYLKSQELNVLNWLWLLRSVLISPWRFDKRRLPIGHVFFDGRQFAQIGKEHAES